MGQQQHTINISLYDFQQEREKLIMQKLEALKSDWHATNDMPRKKKKRARKEIINLVELYSYAFDRL